MAMRCCELGRGPVAERAVWPLLVVVAAPSTDDGARGVQTLEPMVVEALVAEPAVKTFDEGVLRRLAGRDEF